MINDFFPVEHLLDNTKIKVVIYNGESEFYANTDGTLQWIDRLKWSGSSGWKNGQKEFLRSENGVILGTVNSYGKLFFYKINDAGLEVSHFLIIN